MKRPWFADGLRFTCTQCGNCCTGAPGYVWVTDEEIAALAARLGLPLVPFEAQYVRDVNGRKSLVELPNGDCIFFDNVARLCTVYEDRPVQCRTWPFWRSNIRSPEAWQHTCSVCPGSGRGRLYSVEEVLEQARKIEL
jgi:Fe-S-cluster containining protein